MKQRMLAALREGAPLARRIGAQARAERVRQGWTQADVAEKLGLGSEVYGRIERGLMLPSAETLARMCAVLDMEADMACGLSRRRKRPRRAALAKQEGTPESRRLMRVLRSLSPSRLSYVLRLSRLLKQWPLSLARKPGGVRRDAA